MPNNPTTNKTTQWRADFEEYLRANWDNRENLPVADWWIAKHLDTLELLEKEVEGMRELKEDADYYIGGNDMIDKVLAIIRQHKE